MEEYIPFFAAIVGTSMILAAYYTVRGKDLVYASGSLAILGILNAILVALLGYTLVAVFLVLVYVGAAVMFIIMSVSMLGGGGDEKRDEVYGAFAGASVAISLFLLLAGTGLYKAFARPTHLSIARVSEILASDYGIVLVLLFVALAATLVEAISIARRG
ncbi:MAG: NADH-quinone oxidoreductase subunit J [Desulfurococcales archaeon]|nr:NADH-quinone oxidoreductase subunit J [Desulfurococcales archaeon]